MKNVWSILLISAFGVLFFSGLASTLSHVSDNNTLNNEDYETVLTYTGAASSYSANYSSNYHQPDYNYQQNTNNVDPYLVEAAEQKGTITQIWDGLKTLYLIPYLVFIAIPFIDQSTWATYQNIISGLLYIAVTIAVYIAFKTGEVKPNNG